MDASLLQRSLSSFIIAVAAFLVLPTCFSQVFPEESECPLAGCCEEDCCGPGTSYNHDLVICVPDSSSPGFVGYSAQHQKGCVVRECCEADCCTGSGTYYDPVIACCLPCIVVSESQAVYEPDIPPDIYEQIFLPQGETLVFEGLDNLQIQPPITFEGSYQYASDYHLCHDPDNSKYLATFNTEGTYNVVANNNGNDVTTVFVGASIGKKKNNEKGKTGCTNEYEVSNAELVIGDKEDTTDGNTYAEDAVEYFKQEGQKMVLIDNVTDAVKAVADHVNATGEKLMKLTLVEHGNSGEISVGAGQGRDADAEIGKYANDTKRGAYDDFVAGLKDKFKEGGELCIIGCNVGEGDAGKKLADCLAKDININVKVKKGTVSFPKKDGKRYPSSSGEKGWQEASPP